MFLQRCGLFGVAVSLLFLSLPAWAAEPAPAEALELSLRSRVETSAGSGRHHAVVEPQSWDPATTALIVCDVWDLHHCLNAVRRVGEFGPRLNEVVQNARERGVTIINAPSDCMEAYGDHPARRRAMETPKASQLPDDIESWCSRIPSEEQAVYPIDQSDGGEDDDPAEHAEWRAKLEAMGRNPNLPWEQQSDLIEIDGERDYISDKGDEVWSILEERGIENVILTGVHTNMCVLGRPFGLRQMAKNGKNVVLMRDMTDTMYNPARWPYVSHFTGTDYIIEHIEKFVCPTITSDQLIGGEPFVFENDTRPHLVIVMAEDEYQTEQTLPAFARQHLGKAFRVSLLFARDDQPNDIPGTEILDDADVLLVSVRRRPLPPEQLEAFRRFADSGKPMIGIRTASHAFALRGDAAAPEGLAMWAEFDAEVWGGNYTNHYGNSLQNVVQLAEEQAEHPVLKGVPTEPFPVGGSLYKVSPLRDGTTVLMTGRVEGEEPEPVAWTFDRASGGRSFYTSLGYRSDFEGNPDFQRLLVNGIYWAAGLEPPEEITVAGTIEDYRRQWMPMPVPGTWEEGSGGILKSYEGVAWYRCMIRLPESWGDQELIMELPVLPAEYELWLDGKRRFGLDARSAVNAVGGVTLWQTGCTRPSQQGWNCGDLTEIAVRVSGAGCICYGLEDEFPRVYLTDDPDTHVDLTGTWQFRIGDDPSFATLPLPAKFAAATEIVFEPDEVESVAP